MVTNLIVRSTSGLYEQIIHHGSCRDVHPVEISRIIFSWQFGGFETSGIGRCTFFSDNTVMFALQLPIVLFSVGYLIWIFVKTC